MKTLFGMLPSVTPRLLETCSESETSDDTMDTSLNPIMKMSDATVKMLSSRAGSICGIHSSDQCLVRCVQCLGSFCSGLVLYDIHHEVDHAWSCRTCLLQPASVLRSSEVNHSAALASENRANFFESSLIKSLCQPVQNAFKISKKDNKSVIAPTVQIPAKTSSFVQPPPNEAIQKRKAEITTPTAPGLSTLVPAPMTTLIKQQKTVDIQRPRLKRQNDTNPSKKRSATKMTTGDERASKKAKPVFDDFINSKSGKRLKRFRCEYCPKRFDQRSNLTAHIRSHTGEKPFTCKVCKRPFSQKSNMTRHMKVHRR
mmetsp:Transcript_12735/g.23119  ORF Transcript_12735/g.23119 Transcript_12735/m.23119 type:complete len:313 (+) Transcript_12735:104-1042(+)